MNKETITRIISAVQEIYPEELTARQSKYLIWLIEQADKIGERNIGRPICDYLKISHKQSRKVLNDSIITILAKNL